MEPKRAALPAWRNPRASLTREQETAPSIGGALRIGRPGQIASNRTPQCAGKFIPLIAKSASHASPEALPPASGTTLSSGETASVPANTSSSGDEMLSERFLPASSPAAIPPVADLLSQESESCYSGYSPPVLPAALLSTSPQVSQLQSSLEGGQAREEASELAVAQLIMESQVHSVEALQDKIPTDTYCGILLSQESCHAGKSAPDEPFALVSAPSQVQLCFRGEQAREEAVRRPVQLDLNLSLQTIASPGENPAVVVESKLKPAAKRQRKRPKGRGSGSTDFNVDTLCNTIDDGNSIPPEPIPKRILPAPAKIYGSSGVHQLTLCAQPAASFSVQPPPRFSAMLMKPVAQSQDTQAQDSQLADTIATGSRNLDVLKARGPQTNRIMPPIPSGSTQSGPKPSSDSARARRSSRSAAPVGVSQGPHPSGSDPEHLSGEAEAQLSQESSQVFPPVVSQPAAPKRKRTSELKKSPLAPKRKRTPEMKKSPRMRALLDAVQKSALVAVAPGDLDTGKQLPQSPDRFPIVLPQVLTPTEDQNAAQEKTCLPVQSSPEDAGNATVLGFCRRQILHEASTKLETEKTSAAQGIDLSLREQIIVCLLDPQFHALVTRVGQAWAHLEKEIEIEALKHSIALGHKPAQELLLIPDKAGGNCEGLTKFLIT